MTDGSPLSSLKAALASRVEEQEITLRVPKTPVYVKYRAVTQKELSRIRNRFLPPKKQGAPAYTEAQVEKAGLKVNTSVLAEACVGIYLEADGELVSADPEGPAPTFDGRLVELLGESERETQSDIVRLLYTDNDFDIAAAVGSIMAFSGGAEAEVYEDSSGN